MLYVKYQDFQPYRFVLVCDFHTDLRILYIKKNFYERSSMAKWIDLLNSHSIFTQKKNQPNKTKQIKHTHNLRNMCTNVSI